jgi:hypothetical protein
MPPTPHQRGEPLSSTSLYSSLLAAARAFKKVKVLERVLVSFS